MHSKPSHDPGLVAKDAIRGIRFAMKRGAKILVRNGPHYLPDPLEAASSDFLDSAERITIRIDKVIRQTLGLEFDEAEFRPMGIAANNTLGDQSAISRDASNLFFALTLAAKNLGVSDVFISEALCARLVVGAAEDLTRAPDESSELRAFHLFQRILETHAIGDLPGKPGRTDPERISNIALVSFSVGLWTFVPRGTFTDTETEILQICCDIAKHHSTAISRHLVSEAEIIALFRYALDTV